MSALDRLSQRVAVEQEKEARRNGTAPPPIGDQPVETLSPEEAAADYERRREESYKNAPHRGLQAISDFGTIMSDSATAAYGDDIMGIPYGALDTLTGKGEGSLLENIDTRQDTLKQDVADARERMPWMGELPADIAGGVFGVPGQAYNLLTKLTRPASILGRTGVSALAGGADSGVRATGNDMGPLGVAAQTVLGTATGGFTNLLFEGAGAAVNWLTGKSAKEAATNVLTSPGMRQDSLTPEQIIKQQKDPNGPDSYFDQSEAGNPTASIDRATEALPNLNLSLDPARNARKLEQSITTAGQQRVAETDKVVALAGKLSGDRTIFDAGVDLQQNLDVAKQGRQDMLTMFGNNDVPKKEIQDAWSKAFTGIPVGKRKKVLDEYSKELAALMRKSKMGGDVKLSDLHGVMESLQHKLGIKGARKLGDAYSTLTTLKKNLGEVLDRHSGGAYSQSSNQYSRAYRDNDAFTAGEKMMGDKSVSVEDVDQWFKLNKADPELVSQFRDGMQAAIQKRTRTGITAGLRNLFGDMADPRTINANAIAKLRKLIGNDAVEDMKTIYTSVGPRQDALDRYIAVANEKLKHIGQSPSGNQQAVDLANLGNMAMHGRAPSGTGQVASTVRAVTGAYPQFPSAKASEQVLDLLNMSGPTYRRNFGDTVKQGTDVTKGRRGGAVAGGMQQNVTGDLLSEEDIERAMDSATSIMD